MEEGKTLEIPGCELLTKVGAIGTWFGFGQKPHPGQTLAKYSKERQWQNSESSCQGKPGY
jgi:hypothetical protein